MDATRGCRTVSRIEYDWMSAMSPIQPTTHTMIGMVADALLFLRMGDF